MASGLLKKKTAKETHGEMNKKETRYWTIIAAFLICFTAIAGTMVFFQRGSVQENAFTALYFAQYGKNISGDEITFSFTIENHETQGMDYIIDVTVDSTHAKTLPVSLEKDANRTESVSIPFAFGNGLLHKLTVSLRGRPEKIFFWTRAED